MNNVIFAFSLTLVAGLCTGIGGILALAAKKDNRKFLSFSLGFSAGVMFYVSMIEIFRKAENSLVAELGSVSGKWITVIAFFAGMLLIGLIDKLVPHEHNPHEIKELNEETIAAENLKRMGIFTAIAIGIHNFPEGLATFVSALHDPYIAFPIFVAIALHNIPEGIAVSIPIYQATGSKKKAFTWAFLSGLSEPLGALIGYLILFPFLNDIVFGIIFALVAGIMVFISIDELLPTARSYGNHHLSIYGFVSGMALMAVSLLLFI